MIVVHMSDPKHVVIAVDFLRRSALDQPHRVLSEIDTTTSIDDLSHRHDRYLRVAHEE